MFYQDFQIPKVVLKNEAQPSFLAHFQVFGSLTKHSFEFLIKLRKKIIKLRKNEGMKSPKSALIKIGLSRHGKIFLCSTLMNRSVSCKL